MPSPPEDASSSLPEQQRSAQAGRSRPWLRPFRPRYLTLLPAAAIAYLTGAAATGLALVVTEFVDKTLLREPGDLLQRLPNLVDLVYWPFVTLYFGLFFAPIVVPVVVLICSLLLRLQRLSGFTMVLAGALAGDVLGIFLISGGHWASLFALMNVPFAVGGAVGAWAGYRFLATDDR